MTVGDRACQRAVAGGFVLVVVAGGLLVAATGDAVARTPAAVARFAIPVFATWAMVAGAIARTRAAAPPPPTGLGVATVLTLARGGLVSLVAGFLFVPATETVTWLPGILYALAAATDQADGRVARRLGQTTEFGARLDVAMDGLGLLVAPLVAVAWRRLPPWYLLISVSYYLFYGGLWLRRRVGWPAHLERLRPRPVTRVFAGVQMTLVACALLPLPFASPVVVRVAASVLMMPTLILFVRDWFVVSGRLPPSTPTPPPAPPDAPAEIPRR